MSLPKLDRFEFKSVSDPTRGTLRVFNAEEIPFEIRRIFSISGRTGEVDAANIRGR